MSDAILTYITRRSLTMTPPDMIVYHLPSDRHFGERTWCGIAIWSPDQRHSSVVPIRRDIAARIGRPCEVCLPEAAKGLDKDVATKVGNTYA